ncbi:MAG: hypothetical protein M1481_05585 [Candidatus Thermoplasmatota archaeon]|nr:hypothetical protein [Candidatus Thermoplasmatota archaeon]MCL5963325.1 hypothetical protein [Candidatus Thermoplasmatota archaeon]
MMYGGGSPANDELNKSKTLVLIALIWSIIVLLLDALSIIGSIGLRKSNPALSNFYLLFIILYSVSAVLDVYVLIRLLSLKEAIESGDVIKARSINTTGFLIISFFFSGIITAILLYFAKKHIDKAAEMSNAPYGGMGIYGPQNVMASPYPSMAPGSWQAQPTYQQQPPVQFNPQQQYTQPYGQQNVPNIPQPSSPQPVYQQSVVTTCPACNKQVPTSTTNCPYCGYKVH